MQQTCLHTRCFEVWQGFSVYLCSHEKDTDQQENALNCACTKMSLYRGRSDKFVTKKVYCGRLFATHLLVETTSYVRKCDPPPHTDTQPQTHAHTHPHPHTQTHTHKHTHKHKHTSTCPRHRPWSAQGWRVCCPSCALCRGCAAPGCAHSADRLQTDETIKYECWT